MTSAAGDDCRIRNRQPDAFGHSDSSRIQTNDTYLYLTLLLSGSPQTLSRHLPLTAIEIRMPRVLRIVVNSGKVTLLPGRKVLCGFGFESMKIAGAPGQTDGTGDSSKNRNWRAQSTHGSSQRSSFEAFFEPFEIQIQTAYLLKQLLHHLRAARRLPAEKLWKSHRHFLLPLARLGQRPLYRASPQLRCSFRFEAPKTKAPASAAWRERHFPAAFPSKTPNRSVLITQDELYLGPTS